MLRAFKGNKEKNSLNLLLKYTFTLLPDPAQNFYHYPCVPYLFTHTQCSIRGQCRVPKMSMSLLDDCAGAWGGGDTVLSVLYWLYGCVIYFRGGTIYVLIVSELECEIWATHLM